MVITAGQGGTGFLLIQLAKAMGAARVITAATGAGIATCMTKALGVDLVIDYQKQKLSDVLPANSVDVVVDNLGMPKTADALMPAMRSGGTLLVMEGTRCPWRQNIKFNKSWCAANPVC